MAEYINKEAVRDALYEADAILMSGLKILNQFPAADVAPVRHGRWVNANNRKKTYQRRCTSCGEIAYYCGICCSYKFCPNCGCCMDGGVSDA